MFIFAEICAPTALRAQSATSWDGQAWTEVDLIADLTDRVTLTVPMVMRSSFNLPNPQLAGLGPVFDVSVAKFLSVTGGYLFVALPKVGAGFYVHVPLAAVTIHQAWHRFHISDRNRAEELFGLPHSPIRYRNKLAFDLALGRWEPFISDEVFYDFSQSAWTQNRLEVGAGVRLNQPLRLDLYYLERSAHKTEPSRVHALGLTLEIHLKTLKRKFS